MTKSIRNCCWNELSRMREKPAHLLSQVKVHQQSKQRLMVFKLIQIHFSEISSVEKINKLFSRCSESKHREKLSELLFIRAGAIAEALPRTPHCQALSRGRANSQPWSHSHCTGTHCCHRGPILVPQPLTGALKTYFLPSLVKAEPSQGVQMITKQQQVERTPISAFTACLCPPDRQRKSPGQVGNADLALPSCNWQVTPFKVVELYYPKLPTQLCFSSYQIQSVVTGPGMPTGWDSSVTPKTPPLYSSSEYYKQIASELIPRFNFISTCEFHKVFLLFSSLSISKLFYFSGEIKYILQPIKGSLNSSLHLLIFPLTLVVVIGNSQFRYYFWILTYSLSRGQKVPTSFVRMLFTTDNKLMSP